MVERIVREFNPLKVILFGSYARGDAGPDSDVDLLVVVAEVEDKREASVAMRTALADAPLPKDIIVTTPEEIERRGTVPGTILRPALREGIVVYERG
jgi:predicted nucleotidyltransferase